MTVKENDVRLFFNKHLVTSHDIYDIHSTEAQDYQDINKLIGIFEIQSTSILIYEYECLNEVIIPYHWHDWYEIIYIFEGSVDVYVENKRYSLKANDFFYFPSGIMHKTINFKNSKVMVMHIKNDYIKRQLPGWADQMIELEDIRSFDNKVVKQNKEIAYLIEQIYEISNENEFLGAVAYQSSLCLIMYKLAKYYGREKKKYTPISEKYKKRLLEIFDYVEENVYEKIQLKDVARHLSISPQYLSEIFRKYLNTTFVHYVNELRLDKALKDIVYSDINLIDIAMNYGFANYDSFTRTCKEKYDMTPSEYRKRYQVKKD